MIVTHISSQGSQTYSLPVGDHFPSPFILGENGVAYTYGYSSGMSGANIPSRVMSFDMNSGNRLWTYDAPPQADINLVAATDDNGLLLTSQGNVTHYDSQGNQDVLATLSTSAPLAYFWSGGWYSTYDVRVSSGGKKTPTMQNPRVEM